MADTLNDAVKIIKDQAHRGDVDITTDPITAKIVRAINESRKEIIRKLPKLWIQSPTDGTIITVQGTTIYALNADLQEPILFRYTDTTVERLIEKVDSQREFYKHIFSNSAAQDRPRHYVEIAPTAAELRQIQIFPPPDKVYTITYPYYKDPTGTRLTVSDLASKVPDVPNHLLDYLWKKALYYFLKSFDDNQAAEQALRDAREAMDDVEMAEEMDADTDLAFRFGIDDRFTDPNTFNLR